MGKRLFFWSLGGFAFTAALGTLLHFVYDWSGESLLVAAFAAVNESTWEHMKILFFPMFVFSVVQISVVGKNYPNFPAVRAVSALVGISLIPILFYTYSGVLGYSIPKVNIAIFYVSAFLAFQLDRQLLRRGRLNESWMQVAGLAVLWGLAFCFVWCTFHPPELGLWRDPLTGTFGS